jgi:subtilisin family serine protease
MKSKRRDCAPAFLFRCLAAAAAYGQMYGQNSVRVSGQGQLQSTFTIVGAQDASRPGKRGAYHPTRILVRFKNGGRRAFLPGSGQARGFTGDPNLFVVDNPPGVSVPEAVRGYATNPDVLYAEPDFIVHALDTIPSDPRWSDQWDMTRIAAPQAWDTQTNAGDVVVAVIDTGIDSGAPDLRANLWTNPADGSHGFTCIGGACVAGGVDDFGHGTHVAGTIGAAANDGVGIAGINWQVQLLSLKFLDSSGSGSTSDAILCFDKATELKQSGVNIRITNNSWGGGGFDQALKDAMARAEAAGILHACAAGNSNVNADANPMYPAAFDNRGIISVLATDSNDIGASFTNYGLASVDIAAPGVNTLSTVPTGTCTLCDSSGYKFLSGTSMATPHVAGVVAALFHANPSLSTNEARDVLLDPASCDALVDPKAATSSTGGRLNFFKALSNPLLTAPHLNGFPTLTVSPDVTAAAGDLVTLSTSASDPDGDALRTSWARLSPNAWLFGFELTTLFPSPTGNPFSFTVPSLGRDGFMGYQAAAADGRGGGAVGSAFVVASANPGAGQPPFGTLSVNPSTGSTGTTVTVTYPATDPEGGPILWELSAAERNATSGWCCFSSPSVLVTLNDASVYRIRAQAIDRELNVSTNSSAVVRIGGASGSPPTASAVADVLSGPVPLTVHWDASASHDDDGTITNFFVFCNSGGFAPPGSSTGTCVYDTPGAYDIFIIVQDNDGYEDTAHLYIVAEPPAGGTPLPTSTRIAASPPPTPTATAVATSTATSTRTPTTTATRSSTATPTRTAPPMQTPAADLVESAVSNPPATVARRGSFSVTDTVLNRGTAAAAVSTTRYYLSVDTVKNGPDKLLTGSRAVAPLGPGATSTGSVLVQLPNGAQGGPYFLLACADDTKTVSESNEGNNCTASATQVRVQ